MRRSSRPLLRLPVPLGSLEILLNPLRPFFQADLLIHEEPLELASLLGLVS